MFIDDIVFVRRRYSCGREGWACGKTRGMLKQAEGVFPLAVVMPMVLIVFSLVYECSMPSSS